MKDVVSDFLFYAEAKHRDSIIQSVNLASSPQNKDTAVLISL